MYHFARYDIESGEVLAEFTTSSKDLLPLARPGEAFIEVPEEHARRSSAESSDPTRTRLRGTVVDGRFRQIGRVAIHEATLELSADLRDLDGDGVLDAPADGTTEIPLRIAVSGTHKGAGSQERRIRLQTTAGSLSSRFATVAGDTATVTLRTSTETVVANVTATADGCKGAALLIEFVPPDEFGDGKQSAAAPRKRASKSSTA
ncbi:MAG: FG-GAP repeat domain-containing protein [Thermomicrobiales bacterium]